MKEDLIRLKKIRINELEDEISEIQAMYAHIEDQMTTINEDIKILKKKIIHMEKKKQEAIYNGKIATPQSLLPRKTANTNYTTNNPANLAQYIFNKIS